MHKNHFTHSIAVICRFCGMVTASFLVMFCLYHATLRYEQSEALRKWGSTYNPTSANWKG